MPTQNFQAPARTPAGTDFRAPWALLKSVPSTITLYQDVCSSMAPPVTRRLRSTVERKTQFNIWYVILAALGVLLLQDFWEQSRQVEPIPYSRFEKYLDEGRIEKVVGPGPGFVPVCRPGSVRSSPAQTPGPWDLRSTNGAEICVIFPGAGQCELQKDTCRRRQYQNGQSAPVELDAGE